MQKTTEQRMAGSRTEGNFHTTTASGGQPDEPTKVRFFLQLDDRCDGCPWPDTCEGDRTCWRQERVAEIDVVSHRRKERLAALGIEDRFAAGIHVVLPEEPHEPAQKLLETLGATYEVLDGEPAPPHLQAVGTLDVDISDADIAEPVSARDVTETAEGTPFGLKRWGKGYLWTRDAMVLSFQAFHDRHGYRPSWDELQKAHGDDVLPTQHAMDKLGVKLSDLTAEAGLAAAPTRRQKDSSGPAVSRPAHPGLPDEQEPQAMAVAPAPPPADLAQPVRAAATPAADAGSTPAVRFALLGVLDSLRVLVDAVFPEAAE